MCEGRRVMAHDTGASALYQRANHVDFPLRFLRALAIRVHAFDPPTFPLRPHALLERFVPLWKGRNALYKARSTSRC